MDNFAQSRLLGTFVVGSKKKNILSVSLSLVITYLILLHLPWRFSYESASIYSLSFNRENPNRDQESPKSEEITSSLTPPSPHDPKKVAFLVETRPLPHLPALFAHMTSIMPPEWTVKFMGSGMSIDFMRSSPTIARLESSSKLQIIPIPSNYSVTNRESISQMFTDPHLYREILAPAEHLLVFQPDSILCANSPATLNDFLHWDWIGAPWSKTATFGGNGGLSLRRVSKVLQVLDKEQRRDNDVALEDLWLSIRLARLAHANMPHANTSKTFSVESVWDDTPLGYHIGWLGVHHEQIWDDPKQVDHILRYCPEVKLILGMKLDNDKPRGVS
ncbi:hypothetical protein PVAG01_07946 [Phlyctema vagabunda]|uniref:DUF5672 domain-containing protein n=1 Tax=Phlyctema vagabunda TaxID=108571 RepID=A0ABR4PDU5_9HELO